MTAFAELGLSEAALAAVERMGYDSPTPVQEQSIPYILEGRDVIAAASTGTGKTAAFLLPTLSTLERMKGRGRAPRVCVVSPTRELAQQISRTCMQISRKTGHFVTTVYGGTPYGPQIRELRGGTDVLIATPGRLNDLMDRGVVDLSETKVLVLSARGEVADKVAGLDSGANDYLTKPFHLDELAARIRSLTLRRFTQNDTVLTCGSLNFDTKARAASVGDEVLSLTRKETGILEYLMLNQGRPVSQEELLEHVWDCNANSFSNSARVHMSALRKKLRESLGHDPISNRIGQGYVMEERE